MIPNKDSISTKKSMKKIQVKPHIKSFAIKRFLPRFKTFTIEYIFFLLPVFQSKAKPF